MGRKLAFILVSALILWAPANGQGQKTADKSYVLKASRMFDGKSGTLVTPGVVVVTGGKIVGVGASATVPTGAEVIELGDATLLPGFIDAHTHLTFPYSEDRRAGTTGHFAEDGGGADAGFGYQCARNADGGIYDGARCGLQQLYGRGFAQRDSRRGGAGAADAGDSTLIGRHRRAL